MVNRKTLISAAQPLSPDRFNGGQPKMSVTILEIERGVFRLRIEQPRDPETGKRKFRYERVTGTREDADFRRLEILRAAKRGEGAPILARQRQTTKSDNLSTADYLNSWVNMREHRSEISESTAGWYKAIINYALPYIGHIPLSELKSADVQTCLDGLLNSVSARTVRHVSARLSSAFGDAEVSELIARNPMSGKKVRLPKAPAAKVETLTPEDVQAFVKCAADKFPKLAPLLRFAVLTGMRRGELCALQWRDVSISYDDAGEITGGAVRVRRSAVQQGASVIYKAPKTTAGNRTVAIPPTEARTLLVLAGGDIAAMPPEGFVFATQDGTGRLPNALTQQVNRAMAACGLERFTMHDLRHAHATHLLAAGKPLKAVSQRLGHADVSVTMRTYQHVTTRDDEALASFAEELLSPKTKDETARRNDDDAE